MTMFNEIKSGQTYHVGWQDFDSFATIDNNGVQIVDNGGVALFTVINAGGGQIVNQGGFAEITTVKGLQWIDGGTAVASTIVSIT